MLGWVLDYSWSKSAWQWLEADSLLAGNAQRRLGLIELRLTGCKEMAVTSGVLVKCVCCLSKSDDDDLF